jgi:hypothetical protein
MATYDIQAILNDASGIEADAAVNLLHYEISAPDTVAGTCDDIAAAYQTINNQFASTVNGLTLKVYETGLNPTGPTFTKDYPALTGSSSAGPRQIAVALSYATADDWESSTPRRRGRIYLGPLGGKSEPTILAGDRTAFLAFGQALASAGNASNTTWLMHSKTDNSYHKIEVVSVDDSWDVIRRRKLKPTVRQSADVQ